MSQQNQVEKMESHVPEYFGLPYFENEQIRKIPCCTFCAKEMEFVEGDVIYGENWYHANCWKSRCIGGK